MRAVAYKPVAIRTATGATRNEAATLPLCARRCRGRAVATATRARYDAPAFQQEFRLKTTKISQRKSNSIQHEALEIFGF